MAGIGKGPADTGSVDTGPGLTDIGQTDTDPADNGLADIHSDTGQLAVGTSQDNNGTAGIGPADIGQADTDFSGPEPTYNGLASSVPGPADTKFKYMLLVLHSRPNYGYDVVINPTVLSEIHMVNVSY